MRQSRLRRPIKITTNLDGLAGMAGGTIEAAAAHPHPLGFLIQCARSDLVIIDNSANRLFLAGLLRPFAGFKLISVDLILRPPVGWMGRVIAALKRTALTGVDRFLLYFRNIDGFERYYGIGSDRTAYVPFKVNGWGAAYWPSYVPAGDYVLCAGRTLRDLDTFVAAMGRTGLPGVLLQQSAEIMKEHGTTAWHDTLPANVQLSIHADGTFETFLSAIAKAKIVVIPRFKADICSTGISTYLVAMALGKGVIISRGPGADDVLRDEAVFVEPENIDELAAAISRLWYNDDELVELGGRAKRYAENLGGSVRLNEDVLKESLGCLSVSLQPQSASGSGTTYGRRDNRADDRPRVT